MIRSALRLAFLAAALGIAFAGGCAHRGGAGAVAGDPGVAATPSASLRFVVYGDMRFTSPAEQNASVSGARQAIVAQIAREAPAAVLLTGDVPWHGVVTDYEVFRTETAVWREHSLAVYPALGNHEFYQCAEPECLERWWDTFPALRGRRWYSVTLGAELVAIALDSDAPLDAGSAQRAWLDAELARLPATVDFVLVYLHHPPVADVQGEPDTSHNPRPNERALAARLEEAAAAGRVRFLVCAGHIHNYERREEGGVVYLVSGGGGAHPVNVVRDAADRYQGPGFPNFHYLRFTLADGLLRGEMLRLEDYDAPAPGEWRVRDSFELRAAPR